MRQGRPMFAAGRVRSKKKKRKKNEIPANPKHTTKFTAQPRDRDHREAACDETRPVAR